jgi:hypothetical protein
MQHLGNQLSEALAQLTLTGHDAALRRMVMN